MTTNEIYAQMLADFQAATGYEMDGACDLAVRLYAVSAQLETLYYYADWSRRQAFAQTASAEYLDYHGQTRDLYRKSAVRATGEVRFYIPAALPNDLVIPAGTVVSTLDQIRFYTIQDETIDAGSLYGDISAQAEQAGADGNVGIGTIVCLTQAPAGVSACMNIAEFTGGMDAEEDEAFRARILASFAMPANGGNAAFYKQAALAHEDVSACVVLPRNRGTGTVDVCIASPQGLPSAALVQAVQDELDAQRELGVDVLVSAPKEVPIDITGVLWPADGVSYLTASHRVRQALSAFFCGERLGKKLYKAQLYDIIYGTGVVKNYTLSAPLGDYNLTATQLPTLGTVTLAEGT